MNINLIASTLGAWNTFYSYHLGLINTATSSIITI